jgi:hypothetical protein
MNAKGRNLDPYFVSDQNLKEYLCVYLCNVCEKLNNSHFHPLYLTKMIKDWHPSEFKIVLIFTC